MNFLWSHPEVVVSIIKNAELDDLKKYLAPLFIDNFYENLFSKSSVENNLIYIFALLLKSEINELKNFSDYDKFLNDTHCSILFERLRKKNDIQSYFKKISEKIIKKFENKYNTININFDKDKLQSNKSIITNFQNNQLLNKNNIENLEKNFINHYLQNLVEEMLIDYKNDYKNDKVMVDFLDFKIEDCKTKSNIYSPEKVFQSYTDKNSNLKLKEINYYQFNFMIVINFINEIIQALFDNLSYMPYSIKCICKIINNSIRNKFKKIQTSFVYLYIVQFLFNSIFIPYLNAPNQELLMSEHFSSNTLKNLSFICMIFNRFISASFFKSEDKNEWMLTPFNKYFIDKIKEIFNLCDKINVVQLPEFINKLINNELNKNFIYDYFEENKNQIFYYRSIFYNEEQIKALFNTLEKRKNQIFEEFKNEKISKEIEIEFDNFKKSQYMKNNEIKKIEKKKSNIINDNNISNNEQKIIYSIIHSLKINDKYKYIFDFNNSIHESNYIAKENDNEKLYEIKIKNMFHDLLCNIDDLEELDLDTKNMVNFVNIFERLNSILSMSNNESDNDMDNKRLLWYCKSILEYFNKLPKNSKEYFYNKMIDELEKEINNSIKNVDFGILNELMSKIQLAKEKLTNYQNINKDLDEFKLNNDSRKIIKDNKINVDVIFKYEKEADDFFKIKISNNKINKYQEKYKKSCTNIKEFINEFPNLIIYEDRNDVNIFDLQKKLEFPKQIKGYFKIIENDLLIQKISNLDLIKTKIKEYIIINIYSKIFRSIMSNEDNTIFKNCFQVSWVKLNNFIKTDQELYLTDLENEIQEYLISLTEEKGLEIKFKYLNKIFESIEIFQKFNGIKNCLVPFLRYVIIKSVKQEMMLYSTVEFMELYFDLNENQKDMEEKFDIFKNIIYKELLNIDYKYLINITKEEFDKKCKEVRNPNYIR